MPKLYDVVKAAGKYVDASGQEKTRWIKCGMIVKNPTSGSLSLKLDVIPIGLPTDGDIGVWFTLMQPNRDGQRARGSQVPPQHEPNQPWPEYDPTPPAPRDDDIPF